MKKYRKSPEEINGLATGYDENSEEKDKDQ